MCTDPEMGRSRVGRAGPARCGPAARAWRSMAEGISGDSQPAHVDASGHRLVAETLAKHRPGIGNTKKQNDAVITACIVGAALLSRTSRTRGSPEWVAAVNALAGGAHRLPSSGLVRAMELFAVGLASWMAGDGAAVPPAAGPSARNPVALACNAASDACGRSCACGFPYRGRTRVR